MGDVDREEAIEIARGYADEECVGQLGDVLAVTEGDGTWTVEFRTHTYGDSYDHRVKVTETVGNVISHERGNRIEWGTHGSVRTYPGPALRTGVRRFALGGGGEGATERVTVDSVAPVGSIRSIDKNSR